jgi:hypothetical protein
MTPEQAHDLVDAMARARTLHGDVGQPSDELLARVWAPELLGFRRKLRDEGFIDTQAGVVTKRGSLWVSVIDKEDGNDPWEVAFRELGILD